MFRWLREHPEFREVYVFAKQAQAELVIEEALAIADNDSQDVIVTPDGRRVPNRSAIRRNKIQVEYRKWLASRMLGSKYRNVAGRHSVAE